MSDTAASLSTEETKPGPRLPMAGADLPAHATPAESERNEVFTSLVSGDDDIVGLVAYSIYKQNKHDWLIAFNKLKDREPFEDELLAYIIGESTPRRLATYRHLAEATLEGRGPKITMSGASEKFVQRSLANGQAVRNTAGGGGAVAWIIAGVVALAAVLLAGKYGIPGLR